MNLSKVTQQKLGIVFLIVVILATLVSRIYGLTFKPIHFDESINAWFSSEIQRQGFYRYDPNNYHGPLYFYVLRVLEVIFGKSLVTLRAVPTIFAIGAVGFMLLPVYGRPSWRRWVATFFLISPAFIFFGRSAIHEMPFVFFQVIFGLGILRVLEKKDDVAISCLLIGLFGMVTLKETFVLTLFSFAVALLFAGRTQLKNLFNWGEWQAAWNRRLTVVFLLLLWLFVMLFSGFFKNLPGLLDFVRAFLPWIKTGTAGNGHDKPFVYWLETLYRAEPLVLFALMLSFVGIFSKTSALRVVSVFSILQLLLYSLIPYKTVWCILSLVWGFYFVLAFSFAEAKTTFQKYAAYAVVGCLALFNLESAYNSSFKYPIELSHPYVYVNSTYGLDEVHKFIVDAAASQPEGFTVQLGVSEQWPWPWLLRQQQITSYELCSRKIQPTQDIYFCDIKETPIIEGTLQEPYWKLQKEFRQDSGVTIAVYFKKAKFAKVPFAEAEQMGGEIK